DAHRATRRPPGVHGLAARGGRARRQRAGCTRVRELRALTMRPEPRIRVSAVLRWHGQILLIRHEKRGREHWLLPGGGVHAGETLTEALQRELAAETGIARRGVELPVAGPVAIVESISSERGAWQQHSGAGLL